MRKVVGSSSSAFRRPLSAFPKLLFAPLTRLATVLARSYGSLCKSLACIPMAGFKTHVTTSSVLGVGYGVAGFYYLGGEHLPSCVLATGLCGVSGMLPDLD